MPKTSTAEAPAAPPRYVLIGSRAKFHNPLPSGVERWRVSDVSHRLHEAQPRTVFLSFGRASTDALLNARLKETRRSRFAQLLALEPPRAESVPSLLGLFGAVFGLGPDDRWLPAEELITVLSSEEAAGRFIGGAIDLKAQTVTLVRGDRETMVLPFSQFEPSGSGVAPDFGKLSFTDHGRTVAFGPYEAASDAILYESDADYRRRLNKQRREEERGFGPSLRRLRLQKKLQRDAFPPSPRRRSPASNAAKWANPRRRR